MSYRTFDAVNPGLGRPQPSARRNSTWKPPRIPRPPTDDEFSEEDELARLKEKLHRQRMRGFGRPSSGTPTTATTDLVSPPSSPNISLRYYSKAKTSRSAPTVAAVDDPEIVRLTEQLHRSEERMERRIAKVNLEWQQRPVIPSPTDIDGPTTAFGDFSNVDFRNRSPNNSRSESYTQNLAHSRSTLRRRASSIRVNGTTMALLRGIRNNADIEISNPAEVDVQSEGDVFGPETVLKCDAPEWTRGRVDQYGIFNSAPCFRIVPHFHVAGCAQPELHGFRCVMNEIASSYEGTVAWIVLREEPIVYLNGLPFVARGQRDPKARTSILGITGARLTMMEEKLKREVIARASHRRGNIGVHREFPTGAVEHLWEAVRPEAVTTLSECMNALREEGYELDYHRLPVVHTRGPSPEDYQFVLSLLMERPSLPMVFVSQSGRGRTSKMMLIAIIAKFYLHCTAEMSVDASILHAAQSASFRTLNQIVALLPNGHIHERRVRGLSELADKVYSIAEHVSAAFSSKESRPEALELLQQLAYYIGFSCYCDATIWAKSFKGTFSQWLASMPEVLRLIQSIPKQREHQAQMERIMTPVGEDSQVAVEVKRRRGNILSSNMILMTTTEYRAEIPSTIDGVMALRQLAPNVPFFTCGRVSQEGRESLLVELRQHCPNRIVWISLRAEPSVFINGVAYVVGEYSKIDHVALSQIVENNNSMTVSSKSIEDIEERLKDEVLIEASSHDGKLIVHQLSGVDGGVQALRETVKHVETPLTHMKRLTKSMGVEHTRLPLAYHGMLLPSDLDALIDHFRTIRPGDVVILSDSDGALRTTLALNILTAITLGRHAHLRTLSSVDALIEALEPFELEGLDMGYAKEYARENEIVSAGSPSEPQIASQLCQMLANGSMLRVAEAISVLGGRGSQWNLLDAIADAAQRVAVANLGEGHELFQEAVGNVNRYLLQLLCCIYASEGATIPFSEWCFDHGEAMVLLQHLLDHPQRSIALVAKENLMEAHSKERAVYRRSGDVLTANYCLKADHFPGCQKKTLRPCIAGAPNFRKVQSVNVYGVAIPTQVGVRNVLSLLGAFDRPLQGDDNDDDLDIAFPCKGIFDFDGRSDGAESGSVVWINMRGEPIVYIEDRPFVLRNLTTPFVNVELKGIEASNVDHIEARLKRDILADGQQYDSNFLVHDEGKPGELVGIWLPSTEETVQTVHDVFDSLQSMGARVTFVRLPVTDEQSPEFADFDVAVRKVLPLVVRTKSLKHTESVSFVINCQMGRGRTTTGMVIVCLLLGTVYTDYFPHLEKQFPNLYDGESSFGKGNYACINDLRRLLRDGGAAKRRLDLVLEACGAMQNLRTAIEVLQKQVNSSDLPDELRGRAHLHGVNYLKRYFNLVAFSAYLEENYQPQTESMTCTFASWMANSPDILHLLDSAELV